jgi:cytochrome oxidase assembly protein ShyY1
MKRIPIIATLVVLAAVAAMVALGVWQLHRKGEKEAMIARYAQAATLPPVAYPAFPPATDALLFRRASGFCLEPVAIVASAGRNLAGASGWRHVASCRTGAEGPGMEVDIGWSRSADMPRAWGGGEVTGVLTQGTTQKLRLVAATPAPGLMPSLPPTPADIPNNHLGYAIQWFAFAAIAAIIYVLALRRRQG